MNEKKSSHQRPARIRDSQRLNAAHACVCVLTGDASVPAQTHAIDTWRHATQDTTTGNISEVDVPGPCVSSRRMPRTLIPFETPSAHASYLPNQPLRSPLWSWAHVPIAMVDLQAGLRGCGISRNLHESMLQHCNDPVVPLGLSVCRLV